VSAAPLIEALAARHPDSVVWRGDRGAWRAHAVLDEIRALARQLAGTRVLSILADNSPDWAMADLAALEAGVPVLPLPAFFSPSQLAHALGLAGADLVVSDRPERILALESGFAVAGTRRGLTWLRRDAAPAVLPAGTAKISFTSGSTGAPKGVCLSAEGLVDTASALAAALSGIPVERHLAALPLALLLENVAGIYAPLLRGAQIHLPGLAGLGWRGMSGFDAQILQRAVAEARPNSLILVPELLKAWTLCLARDGLRAPAELAFVAVGGARVEPESLARARRLGLPAYQGYGLTECGSVVCLNRPGDDGDGVGRPLPHVRASIRDGEVRIASRAFLGYLGGARSRPGDAYATGDFGRFDAEGHLHLSGRRGNLLITSFGRNVAPEWVESLLVAQPQIAQAIVAGEGRPWLAAVVVPLPGASRADLAAAIARTNAALPDYARLGGWLEAAPFVPEDGTLTGNGRPVRAAVLQRHAAQLAALYAGYHPQETNHDVL
jgi:long-subunit acyl-CoA synthetase (AMP-forming)